MKALFTYIFLMITVMSIARNDSIKIDKSNKKLRIGLNLEAGLLVNNSFLEQDGWYWKFGDPKEYAFNYLYQSSTGFFFERRMFNSQNFLYIQTNVNFRRVCISYDAPSESDVDFSFQTISTSITINLIHKLKEPIKPISLLLGFGMDYRVYFINKRTYLATGTSEKMTSFNEFKSPFPREEDLRYIGQFEIGFPITPFKMGKLRFCPSVKIPITQYFQLLRNERMFTPSFRIDYFF